MLFYLSSLICFVFIAIVSCFVAQAHLELQCFSASAPSIAIIGLCVSPIQTSRCLLWMLCASHVTQDLFILHSFAVLAPTLSTQIPN